MLEWNRWKALISHRKLLLRQLVMSRRRVLCRIHSPEADYLLRKNTAQLRCGPIWSDDLFQRRKPGTALLVIISFIKTESLSALHPTPGVPRIEVAGAGRQINNSRGCIIFTRIKIGESSDGLSREHTHQLPSLHARIPVDLPLRVHSSGYWDCYFFHIAPAVV